MYNIKFVYLFSENVSPVLFAKIIRLSVAGQWIMPVPDNSICFLWHCDMEGNRLRRLN